MPILKLSFVGAPVGLLISWVLMRPLHLRDSPGLGWTVAHAAWIVAFACFLVVCTELRRMGAAGGLRYRCAANAGLAMAVFGLVAGIGQMGVDLWTGFAATTKDGMDALSTKVSEIPGLGVVLYTVGPLCFFIGMLTLFAVLTVQRRLSIAAPLLVIADTLLMGIDKDLAVFGVASIAVALWRAWQLVREDATAAPADHWAGGGTGRQPVQGHRRPLVLR